MNKPKGIANGKKEFCPRGHKYEGYNLIVVFKDNSFQRSCRTCINASNRKSRERRKDKIRVNWLNYKKTKKGEMEKDRARKTLNNAISDGRAVRGSCVVCGKPNAHGHHTDYSKPMEVIWLCIQHHSDLHRRGMTLETLLHT